MSATRFIMLSTLVAVIAASAGYLTYSAAPEVPPATAATGAARGAPPAFDDIALRDLEGAERRLAEWAGDIVIVNFWATWCPPCRKEIPAFIALQKELDAAGVQFVGVALDDPEAVAEYAAEMAINYPLLVGGDDVTVLMRKLGNTIGALPFTAVFDRAGELQYVHQGEWHREEAAAHLRAML